MFQKNIGANNNAARFDRNGMLIKKGKKKQHHITYKDDLKVERNVTIEQPLIADVYIVESYKKFN